MKKFLVFGLIKVIGTYEGKTNIDLSSLFKVYKYEADEI